MALRSTSERCSESFRFHCTVKRIHIRQHMILVLLMLTFIGGVVGYRTALPFHHVPKQEYRKSLSRGSLVHTRPAKYTKLDRYPIACLLSQTYVDEDEDEEGNFSKPQRSRRRDFFKDWISSSPSKSMVQPIGVDGAQAQKNPQTRMKPQFNELFAGMPSMDDILSAESIDNDNESSYGQGKKAEPQKGIRAKQDNSWFEPEKQRIVDRYEEMLKEMLRDLERRRRHNHDSVPGNAEAMIKSVLQQEMDREIKATRDDQGEEQLKAYELEGRAKVEDDDLSGPVDESLLRLIDESEADYVQRKSSGAELDAFLLHQAETFSRERENAVIGLDNEEIMPEIGANLDQWALERLQEMIKQRQGGEEMVLDILEENVEDLRGRMEKAGNRGRLRPETMKEWQMYRAITSRLAQNDDQAFTPLEGEDARETRISERLDAWKDYIEKEEGVRKEFGLVRGPKLPFEWQESNLDRLEQSPVPSLTESSKADIRRQINHMAVQAMESLLKKSDPGRRVKLQKEIDYLKQTLESSDYLDVEDIDDETEIVSGPVDVSDVFARGSQGPKKTPTQPVPKRADEEDRKKGVAVKISAVLENEEGTALSLKRPMPSTPFFTDSDEGDKSSEKETFTTDSRLGSMEDQKIQAMFRRAGAKTVEEQAEIRKRYEDFRLLEKGSRDASGLSGEGTGKEFLLTDLKYNVSEILNEDGDFDAATILSTIGPRPTRRKTTTSNPYGNVNSVSDSDAKLSIETFGPSTVAENSNDNRYSSKEVENARFQSDVDEAEVFNSLYRSVSAVGGGRYKDDPEAKAKQQAAFSDYMKKENRLRHSLDTLGSDSEGVDFNTDIPFDDIEYADEVISSLGARPTPKRTRVLDEEGLSDGKSREKDDVGLDDISDTDIVSGMVDSIDDETIEMPDWLRRENESRGVYDRFQGGEIDSVFDDTDSEKNLRQLAEYEKRRSGKQLKHMGIDVSDVLGRSSFEIDDYADYKFDDSYQRGKLPGSLGTATFEGRKRNLLDYRELEVAELNNLMDHKDSVYSTGVSQYMPRVNKPFKEFGAIFRLEGVLLDISGLQIQAWTKTAEHFSFKIPEVEDVRRAAVTCPEVAIKEIFLWTDDFIQCGHIARVHRDNLRKEFDGWMTMNGINFPESTEPELKETLAFEQRVIKEQLTPPLQREMSEDERIEKAYKAWLVTADELGRGEPKDDDIFTALPLPPDVAVTRVFGWSQDPVEVDMIVKMYYNHLNNSNPLVRASLNQSVAAKEETPQTSLIDEVAVMEIHYAVWTKLAHKYGHECPLPEEVAAAFVIGDPELTVFHGFGWVVDSEAAKTLGDEFEKNVKECIHEQFYGGISASVTDDKAVETGRRLLESKYDQPTPPRGLIPEEVLQVQIKAWTTTAETHGLDPPSPDEVRIAMKMDPKEAIQRLFLWTDKPDEIGEGAETFLEALKNESLHLVSEYRDESFRTRENKDIPQVALSPLVKDPTTDDIFQAAFDAWTETAKKNGFSFPSTEEVEFAFSVGPKEAILLGFQWTDDVAIADELVKVYREELNTRRTQWQATPSIISPLASSDSNGEPKFRPNPTASKWIKSLVDVEMQCGIISYLDRYQVDVLLEQAGLSELIPPDRRVSASNGYTRDTYQMLGAALRLERRPDHCVVFDSTPFASIAAHEVDMQSVSMIGSYPRYELMSADTTSNSLEELTAMNIRRLFAERVYDQPLIDIQPTLPSSQRKTRTKFFFDDDD
jgi:beta-phosphoglucomutase-like phosphatase (HAD superfamily)